jgi:hypothetical protein
VCGKDRLGDSGALYNRSKIMKQFATSDVSITAVFIYSILLAAPLLTLLPLPSYSYCDPVLSWLVATCSNYPAP